MILSGWNEMQNKLIADGNYTDETDKALLQVIGQRKESHK